MKHPDLPFNIPLYLNGKEFMLTVMAANEMKATAKVKRFHKYYFKKKARLYNQLLLLDESYFLCFAEPHARHANKLARYNISIEQNDAIRLLEEIRTINRDLTKNGGGKRKRFGTVLFPFYKFAQDTKYVTEEIIDVFGDVYTTSRQTIDSNLRQENYNYQIVDAPSSKAQLIRRFILAFAILMLVLVTLLSNLSPFMKIATASFSVLLISIYFMPWIMRISADERDSEEDEIQ